MHDDLTSKRSVADYDYHCPAHCPFPEQFVTASERVVSIACARRSSSFNGTRSPFATGTTAEVGLDDVPQPSSGPIGVNEQKRAIRDYVPGTGCIR
jgi:hypothetical protein